MQNTSKNIILIEDNCDHADLILDALDETDVNYRLIHFLDGRSALDFLLSDDKQNLLNSSSVRQFCSYSVLGSMPVLEPNIIFLDIKMPNINGIELLVRIKTNENLKHIPVVMISTSAIKNEIDKCISSGATAYYSKPIESQQLLISFESISDR